VEFQIVNIASLSVFEKGATVNRLALHARKLVDRKNRPVKILGVGELSVALTVEVDAVSGTARTKIEAAGGSVTLPTPTVYRPRHVKKARA
jgi:large subunit ribosomal protein L15